MNESSGTWSATKEILFTFLAVSKIWYWFNTFVAMSQYGFEEMRDVVLMRLLNQDLVIIVLVIIFFFMDRFIHKKMLRMQKYSLALENVVSYVVSYLVFISVILLYMWILNFFTPVHMGSWPAFFGITFVGYVVIAVFLSLKHYFKKKEESGSEPEPALPDQSATEKLTMLQTLLGSGLLTQEEFDTKKALLLERGLA